MNKLALAFRLLAVAVAASGALVFAALATHSAGAEPVKVKAVRLGKGDKDLVSGMGSLKCRQAVDLGFEMSGVISELPVKEGERVAKNQVLAKLDQRQVDLEMAVRKARLKTAVAQLDLARAEHAKKEELYQKEAISESELMKSAFEVQKSEAELDSTQKEVESVAGRKDQMTIRAPTPGIVAKIYLKQGEVANPQSYRVVRLIYCSEIDAEINLGEKLYPMIGPGQTVNVTVDALGGRKFTGTVQTISSEINPMNRTFTATVGIPNPDLVLRPGMFVRAEIDVAPAAGPVWVPVSALLPPVDGEESVFVVKGGLALRRKISIGRRDQERVEVLAGLQAGDVVIVEGQDKVSDLTDVSVSIIGQN